MAQPERPTGSSSLMPASSPMDLGGGTKGGAEPGGNATTTWPQLTHGPLWP
jgi:hypothetical protein